MKMFKVGHISVGHISIVLILMGACFLLGLRSIAAANSAVATHVIFRPTIDGNLNDWSRLDPIKIMEPAQVRFEADNWEGLSDLSGKVYMAWDESALFLAAEVRDDDLVEGTASSFLSDALNLYLDMKNDSTPERRQNMAPYQDLNVDPDDYLFKFVPLVSEGGSPVWEYLHSKGVPKGVETAAKKAAGGYTLEVRIPWSSLGLDGAPAVDSQVGFNVALEDNDEHGFMIWNGGSEGWVKATEYAPLKFMKAPILINPSWSFDDEDDLQGWCAINGFSVPRIEKGAMVLDVTGFDPYVFAPPVKIQADVMKIRLRATGGTQMAVYFDTEDSPGLGEDKKIIFDINADGEFHEYEVPLADHEKWAGKTVTTFRLDLEPAEVGEGAQVAIDYIRFDRGADLAVSAEEVEAQPKLVGIGYECWFPPISWNNAWDKPELGFYDSADREVIRQHAEWLYDAGVDFIWIDWSNNITAGPDRPDLQRIEYATQVLFDEYVKLERRPKISIFLGIDGDPKNIQNGMLQRKVDQVYEQFIANPKYRPLIQDYLGKPLLVIYVGTPSPFPSGVPKWNDERFTVRWMTGFLTQQPNLLSRGNVSRFGYWSWWDRAEQAYSLHDGKPEAMVVSAAWPGHRGWKDPDARSGRRGGDAFREQWARVRKINPRIVTINSWNEWTWSEEYTPEFSNDIEPSVTLGRFYLELMKEEIRLFKSLP